jgi:hypothetical protein
VRLPCWYGRFSVAVAFVNTRIGSIVLLPWTQVAMAHIDGRTAKTR